MTTINFDQQGGFPLTQDKVALIQDNNLQAIAALLGLIKQDYIIITGVELQQNGSYSAGKIKWGDNLCDFSGASSDVTVNMEIENLSDVYFDNINKIFAQKRYITQTNGAGYLLSELPRVEPFDITKEFIYVLEDYQGAMELIGTRKGNVVNLSGFLMIDENGVPVNESGIRVPFELNTAHRPKNNVYAYVGSDYGALAVILQSNGQIVPQYPDQVSTWITISFNVTYFV